MANFQTFFVNLGYEVLYGAELAKRSGEVSVQVVRETFIWLSLKRSGVPPESVVLRERVRDTVLTPVGSSISDREKEATAVTTSSRVG